MRPLTAALVLSLSSLALATPATAIDVNVQVQNAELFDFDGPDVPLPARPPIHQPPPISCAIPSLPICVAPKACAGPGLHVNLYVDDNFLFFVSVGLGGPGAYAGYSEHCNSPPQ